VILQIKSFFRTDEPVGNPHIDPRMNRQVTHR
jgi:hypothetical protein